MVGLKALFFASLPLIVFGSVLPRASAALDTFMLYAYGQGMGGFPVFYYNGLAYAGEIDALNSSDAANVVFSVGTDNSWPGSPNVTDLSTTPSWSNVSFYVPGSSASSKQVGFLSSNSTNSSDVITTGFRFYGNTAMLVENRSLQTLFTAMNTSTEHVQAIYWNDTSNGQVPVTLRAVAPAIPADRLAK